MTSLTCAICSTPRPANRTSDQPWCCSLSCYRAFHGLDQPETPSHHDGARPCCDEPIAMAELVDQEVISQT